MKKSNVYFIVSSLYPTAGGLTKSIYDKASFLADSHNVTILTTNFQLHLESIERELKQIGKLSTKVSIKNLFTDISISDNELKEYIEYDFDFLLKNLNNLILNKVSGNIRVFGKDGIYKNYIAYHKNNQSIHFIDYMNDYDPTILEKRFVFYQNKLLSLDTFKNNQKIQQVIFNSQRKPVLNLWHKDNKVHRIFDMRNNTVIDTSLQQLVNSWLKSFVKTDDVICFDSEFEKNSNYFQNIECKKIGFVHSHQEYCNDTKFLKKFSDFDKFVFLTKLQQEDFKSINPKLYNKSFLIPHPVTQTKKIGKKLNKIVTISRLVHNKPIASAIHAFNIFSRKNPDYIYEIYGIGADSEKLNDLIKTLGLSNKVFIKGYTNQSLNIFSEAQFSISLTKFEGYGLSILESLGMSCPVITSNVNYGPNELIIDGINGHLVNNDKIEMIAAAMDSIASNPTKYQSECLKSIAQNDFNLWGKNLLSIINF